MFDALGHFFAAVCGQNPDHIWSPGGLWLPCCQRCTGLYVDACVAALLHLWLRPKLSDRLLQVHGAFLLLMVPYGFHWLPQGPDLRTITGALFGFGIVTFLWLTPAARWTKAWATKPDATTIYSFGVITTLALLPTFAAQGGRVAVYVLSLLVTFGALVLGALVVANVGLGLLGAARFVRRFARPGTAS
jgi:uncharacterized membrane protein